ncbi:exopolyphosphatase [Enterovibrio norvegicus FF-162]|uniref:Exopolyphosphatase n=1 Tax=Enterovibrio norvegicus FF-454 TaxID=1185651 RepID=A0A1E5C442_9GAMM|nr:exopolyphosphatase [Enterovibrio norvegicus]OEE60308.1 exopolyphosphatase [Enterovibrio norvegicus FF-454]OEE86116.1 exopolyphosphatase [Enterovibrio norvegicus FF-162]
MSERRYRLITRSDFDGLVCAVLLKHIDLIDEIKFVHPKDMQDGVVEINEYDITTNLPYNANAHLCIDHHASELIRNQDLNANYIIDADAPSAARVVWKHFGGENTFPSEWDEMMEEVDKGDSAQYTKDEVLYPKAWGLLNFIMDARTGLGRFREFRISNYELMMDLIEHCRDKSIAEIMELPDVKERVDVYFSHREKFQEQLRRCASVCGNLVILDLRHEDPIWAGNRFEIYAVFPQCNISVHVLWGLKKQNTVFACGKSIFDRTSTTNIGELMLSYNGGGHENAGTCQVPNENAARVQDELIVRINQDG